MLYNSLSLVQSLDAVVHGILSDCSIVSYILYSAMVSCTLNTVIMAVFCIVL